MDLKIDEETLHAAVTSATNAAVVNALEGYEVERVIRERVTASLIESAIGDTVADAIGAIDLEALHAALATQMSRTIVAGAVNIIQESMIDMIVAMRRIPEYDREGLARARAEVALELKSARQQS